jgi:hypothetical protein
MQPFGIRGGFHRNPQAVEMGSFAEWTYMSCLKANHRMLVYQHSCEYHGFWCLGFPYENTFC